MGKGPKSDLEVELVYWRKIPRKITLVLVSLRSPCDKQIMLITPQAFRNRPAQLLVVLQGERSKTDLPPTFHFSDFTLKMYSGVPWWLSRLRIQVCHCSVLDC